MPHHLKVEGSSPASVAVTKRENGRKKSIEVIKVNGAIL
jgi:hypothetical protein